MMGMKWRIWTAKIMLLMRIKKQEKGSLSRQVYDHIKDEDFSNIQEYFKDRSVENTRMAFKIRSHMVTEIPCNFKNKYKKKGNDGLICAYCSENEEMDQSHCMRCPAWSELRKDLDLSSISDVVIFFRKLLTERARVEAESVKHSED